MALYEVECEACGHTDEVLATMAAGPPTKCPKCKKNKLRQAFTKPVAVIRLESPMHPRRNRGKGIGLPKKKEK